jgi:hypothetical protein
VGSNPTLAIIVSGSLVLITHKMETPESLTFKERLIPGYRCVDIGKSITLPLHIFLEYLLGTKDKIYIKEKSIANAISLLDSKQELVHVQTLPVTAERKEELYGIWRIEEWRTCHATDLATKAKAEEENKKYFIRKENIENITKSISAAIGLEYDEAVTLAAKLYDNKQEAVIAMYHKEKVEYV